MDCVRVRGDFEVPLRFCWLTAVGRAAFPLRHRILPSADYQLQHPTDLQAEKRLLYANQDRRCVGCEYELPLHVLTIDHITPRSKGGLDAVGNLQLLCHTCNAVKGNRSMEYLRTQLRQRGILG